MNATSDDGADGADGEVPCCPECERPLDCYAQGGRWQYTCDTHGDVDDDDVVLMTPSEQ